MTTLELVNAALATVQDPELHRALPELGMVKSVNINGDVAELEILLTISGCPMRDRLTRDIETAVTAVEGIARVEITFGAPIVLVVFGDLERLVATDRDLGHYTMVAGASIYPFMWNILLASRSEGLGGVITTMHARVEPEVRDLLNVPDNLSLAGVMMIGHPVHQPTKLRREPVQNFATVDRFDGNPFGVDAL